MKKKEENKKSKYYLTIASVAIVTLMLSGCNTTLPELETQHANLISEYAVDILLSYDSKMDSRLIDTAEIEAERAIVEAEKAEEKAKIEEKAPIKEEMENPSEDILETPIVETEKDAKTLKIEDIDLASILGLDGVEITYSGMEIGKEYPEVSEGSDFVFMMTARAGKELIVFSFDIENTSSETIQLNMLEIQAGYYFGINGEKTESILSTMLINDMATYSGEVAVGELQTLVLVIEVEEGETVDSVLFTIKKDDLEIVVSL